MKLLILVNNYLGKNSTNTAETVSQVLETFAGYTRLETDVVLFSTGECRAENVVNLIYPAELGYDFAYTPRQWLEEYFCCLSHDYFMYTENDLLIPESSVLNCIETNEYLQQHSHRFISGFIRYEQKQQKQYIDMLPCMRPTVEQVIEDNQGKKFWMPGNFHSGNFLLSRRQLEAMIDQKKFQTRPAQYGKEYYGILESAASDIYLDFIKVLPEEFTSVEIEHLPNRYEGLTHQELRGEIASPSGKIGC